ncbi:MAG: serine/threonine-protein phosphatase [Leptospira sp.]|nr:serine/threonine-protein phosphatase [Leptospira sp.]
MSKPVASVGGDFFDVAIFPDALGDAAGKRVGLLVSDVSGHGVPAAFIALMAKIAWQQGTLVENTPSGILRYLNSNLLEKTSGHFLTAFLGIFDMSANTLQYSSGGHIPPVLLREGRPIQDLDGRGSLIGLLPMIKLEDKLIEIQRGDRFVFFTDGLFEARTGQKDLYGMENLSALFDAKRNLEGEEFCDQVICSIRDYIGNTALEDDVTLVVVDVD